MEEVTMAARAWYGSLSAAEKGKIQAWFRSIDRDRDGRISISEFTRLMGPRDYTRRLFNQLDHSRDGFLQFDEFYKLAYIQASGRPLCKACGYLIPGLYFTCTHCRFHGHSFDLCVRCYRAKRFRHPHSVFDDNYTLLRKMQRVLLSQRQARPGAPGYPPSSTVFEDLVMLAFKALVEVVIPGVTCWLQS